jgi:hypothetical protein
MSQSMMREGSIDTRTILFNTKKPESNLRVILGKFKIDKVRLVSEEEKETN